MFKLSDGRTCFWQWDTNRRVLVEDETITEVHFCNRTDDCSLVVEVKQEELFADGELFMTVRYAEVPNILLQQAYPIRVYAFCSDYTKVEELFKVRERTKPSDYAYTETEVRTYNTLDERLSAVEANQIDPDNYATKEYVDAEDDSLKAYVDEKLENYEPSTGSVSLSISDDGEGNVIIAPSEHDEYMGNYYTKEEVDNAIANIEVSGGGGSGKVTHTFTAASAKELTDKDKEMLAYIATYTYTNNKPPEDYVFYVGDFFSPQAISLVNRIDVAYQYDDIYAVWLYTAADVINDSQFNIYANINVSTNEVTDYNSSFWNVTSALPQPQNWVWVEDSSLYIASYPSSHYKIIGYFGSETETVTYDISAPYGSCVSDRGNGCKYFVCCATHTTNTYDVMYLEYNSGSLQLLKLDGNPPDSFTPIGFYYWGV